MSGLWILRSSIHVCAGAYVPDLVVQVRRWEGEGGKDAALVGLL